MGPAELPETLMPISAEAPGLSFPTATQAFLCYVPGLYTPAFWFLPSTVVLLGEGRPGLKLLARLKVFSSPRTLGWKAAVGFQPGFLQPLRQELAQQLCGRWMDWPSLGQEGRSPPPPALAGFGTMSSGRCSEERE